MMKEMNRRLEDNRLFVGAGLCLLLCVACVPDVTLILAQGTAGAKPPTAVWIGPNGSPLPFAGYEEIEEFLSTAVILEAEDVDSGVTKPKKLLLEKDGIRMNAIFRDVNSFKRRWESPKGLRFNFHDYSLFECAAYRLSKVLGMPHVPPAVPRKIEEKDVQDPNILRAFKKREGSIQAWVENAFSDKKRRERELRPPNIKQWAYQFQMMQLFDILISNYDRNQTNILIGEKWKIWFIDSTRAFAPNRYLRETDGLMKCERTVWNRLQSFDEESVRSDLSEFLSDSELKGLLARRLKLVELIQGLIDKRGEKLVLFDAADLNGD